MVLINIHNRNEINRTVATQKSIEEIQKSATIYQMQHAGRLPDSIADLTKDGTDDNPSLLKPDDLVDAWRTPFRFEKDGKAWTITSAGPDRKFGTKDDVTNLGEP